MMSSFILLKKDLEISTKRGEKFGKTSKTMETFCFVVSIMWLNKPNTGKDKDHDDNDNDDDFNDYVLKSVSISVLR
jgi:hypothetical protein